MTGGEGGNEYIPEPEPEPAPEAQPEAPAEPAASEPGSLDAPAAEPTPGEERLDSAGTDRDVLAEGVTSEGRVDTARVAETASRKLTQEMDARLAEAGAERSGETVATGSLSDDPEQAGAQLAAIRSHAEQRAAYLSDRADADKAERDQIDEAMAAEADEIEADRAKDRNHAEEASFRSKLDDGRGLGRFKYTDNPDGTTHVNYIVDPIDKGTKDEVKIGHSTWDEDAEGNRTNVHLTDHQKTGKRKKPIDL